MAYLIPGGAAVGIAYVLYMLVTPPERRPAWTESRWLGILAAILLVQFTIAYTIADWRYFGSPSWGDVLGIVLSVVVVYFLGGVDRWRARRNRKRS